MSETFTNTNQRAGFGGGCHWCTEAVFQSLRGVLQTNQGWIGSTPPHDNLSEAVRVDYDPTIITLADLVTIHLYTHSAASKHRMRKKYRSAVYYFDEHQANTITETINRCQVDFESPLITIPLPYKTFKPSPEQYQNYFIKNSQRPFCTTYITPKLHTLMKRFSHFYQPQI